MNRLCLSCLCMTAAALAALQPTLVRGQTVTATAAPSAAPAASLPQPPDRDPSGAGAPVPQTVYRSPFESYRSHADQAIAPWRTSNDTVRDIGGWRVYAREPQRKPTP